MELNDNHVAITEQMPDGSDYIILSAFERSYDREKKVGNVESFREVVDDLIAQKMVDCKTEEEYANFDNHLKEEVLSFMDIYFCEPWESYREEEPGLAEFIAPVMDYINNPHDFVQTEEFQDALVKYASDVAPYSLEKAQDVIMLTSGDLSQKFIQRAAKISKYAESLNWHKPGEEAIIEHHLMTLMAINNMYPDESMSEESGKLIDSYYVNKLDDYFYNHEDEILPTWDDQAIFGFTPMQLLERKKTGETILEFTDAAQEEAFLDEKITKFINNYVAENSQVLVDKLINNNQWLINLANKIGYDLSSAHPLLIDFIEDRFYDKLHDVETDYSYQTLLGNLDIFLSREYLEAEAKAQEEIDKAQSSIAETCATDIDRSGWEFDEESWC